MHDASNGKKGSNSSGSNDKNVFDHDFEGWSVWLEPCPVQHEYLFKEVQKLSERCGGTPCGCHAFIPHVTLLYNISTDSVQVTQEKNEEEVGLELLQQALQCLQSGQEHHPYEFVVQPTRFHYFEYPKTADDGRGFGCVIHMLLVDKTTELVNLQEAVKQCFPPDERHRTDDDFIPHLAFVYAPEFYAEWLQQYSQQQQQHGIEMLQPFRARYLSLWSTRGKITDWYRIANIEL